MRIYAVDDEALALEMLVDAIKEAYPDVEVKGFMNPLDALKAMEKEPCEVLFSDIEMPEMKGIDFAKAAMKMYPELNVIFITAYDEFALEAIEIHVSGYLQKPVTAQKVEKEMRHLRHKVDIPKKSKCRIQCYGNFEIYNSAGVPVHFHRTKSKELLAYLTHRMGASCSVREIAGILFEDMPYDTKQTRYMQKIISTLISDLEQEGMGDIIIREYNKVALDTTKVDCDYFDNPDRSKVLMENGEYMAQYSWAEYT